jgi:signal transduction histidine kinase
LLYDGKLGPLADRPREFSGRVQASSKHLLHLVNDVLDLSKVETGRMEFRPEIIRVSEVMREVVGILGGLAAGKQIQIQFAVPHA